MNPYRLAGPRHTARLMAWMAERVPPSAWDVPAGPDRFTPREVLAHLADWEGIFRLRMQAAAAEDGAPVEAFDEGQRAADLRYADTEPMERLGRYLAEREATLEWAERLAPAVLERAYLHPERGRITIGATLDLLTAHDAYHLDQLSAALP